MGNKNKKKTARVVNNKVNKLNKYKIHILIY